MANHVRIDSVTQGPDGAEVLADRFNVKNTEDLWIYVEAELPSGAAPEGEYFRNVDVQPDPRTRVLLGHPKKIGVLYRFSVTHFTLPERSNFSFHFADNLDSPTAEDRWEITTV